MLTLRPLKRPTVIVTLLSIIGAQLVDSKPLPEYENPDDWDESLLDDFSINLASDFPRIYGVPNAEVGMNITRETELSDEPPTHPEQLGTYLEGDLLLLKEQRTVLAHASHWSRGIVPYEFASNVDEESKERIMEAFAAFHRHTCIRFQPHNGEPDYVLISSNQEGCYASLGKVPGRSIVNLQKECTTRLGTMLHELMHVLGFVHEQNRWDRDNYVEVMYENIQPSKTYDFHQYKARELNGYDTEYDYNSVMHYSWDAFSINHQPTIISKDPTFNTLDLGQRYYFSSLDVKKLNLVYNCPLNNPTEPPNQPCIEDNVAEPPTLVSAKPKSQKTIKSVTRVSAKKKTTKAVTHVSAEKTTTKAVTQVSAKKKPTKAVTHVSAEKKTTKAVTQVSTKENTTKAVTHVSAEKKTTKSVTQVSAEKKTIKAATQVSAEHNPRMSVSQANATVVSSLP